MQLPIGYDDFRAVIEQKLDFVDKSLFIKERLDDIAAQIAVITRPRRFGKTLNLSMLNYFLAAEVNGQPTAGLFDNLKITRVDNGSYMQHQGKYPVIFITLKDVKDHNFEQAYASLCKLMGRVYFNYRYLLSSDKITAQQKIFFEEIISEKASAATVKTSLLDLSQMLAQYHGKKVWLLIDEYDTPIQESYLHQYYDEMIGFMRGMLGAALKTNPYLDRGVVTGILRIAKESIFSDLNNLTVYSLLEPKYSQYFGFTEEDVEGLLKQANLETKIDTVQQWYNGYRFGNTTIYNPWSIINYVNDGGTLKPYWVNTSENSLIKNLFVQSNLQFKEELEVLLQDQPVEKIVDDKMVFGYLQNNLAAIWSLLVMTGYLKVIAARINQDGENCCQLLIPNLEVKSLYRNMIKQWLSNGQGVEWYVKFLHHLLSGEIPEFTDDLKQVLLQTTSVHDMAHAPEAFYHGLMLGLTVGLDPNKYERKSNRESGLGRYDIAIIPKDLTKLAIILELKSVSEPKVSPKKLTKALEKVLTKGAKEALKQINEKEYIVEITQRGITNIIKIGIAFLGKDFRLLAERQ